MASEKIELDVLTMQDLFGVADANLKLLERELGPGCLEEGGELLGNFYKLSNDPGKPHRGSMAPADFAGGREYALGSLAAFRVVRY